MFINKSKFWFAFWSLPIFTSLLIMLLLFLGVLQGTDYDKLFENNKDEHAAFLILVQIIIFSAMFGLLMLSGYIYLIIFGLIPYLVLKRYGWFWKNISLIAFLLSMIAVLIAIYADMLDKDAEYDWLVFCSVAITTLASFGYIYVMGIKGNIVIDNQNKEI